MCVSQKRGVACHARKHVFLACGQILRRQSQGWSISEKSSTETSSTRRKPGRKVQRCAQCAAAHRQCLPKRLPENGLQACEACKEKNIKCSRQGKQSVEAETRSETVPELSQAGAVSLTTPDSHQGLVTISPKDIVPGMEELMSTISSARTPAVNPSMSSSILTPSYSPEGVHTSAGLLVSNLGGEGLVLACSLMDNIQASTSHIEATFPSEPLPTSVNQQYPR